MTDDLYNSFPLSGDDVVINLRFNAIFSESQPFLSFQEKWVINRIRKHFEHYTFNNSVRLTVIEVLNNQTLMFDFKQIDPEVALEEIIENINANLEEVFGAFNVKITEDFWETVKIYSIGDKGDALEQANEYLKKIKRKNDADGNLG